LKGEYEEIEDLRHEGFKLKSNLRRKG